MANKYGALTASASFNGQLKEKPNNQSQVCVEIKYCDCVMSHMDIWWVESGHVGFSMLYGNFEKRRSIAHHIL